MVPLGPATVVGIANSCIWTALHDFDDNLMLAYHLATMPHRTSKNVSGISYVDIFVVGAGSKGLLDARRMMAILDTPKKLSNSSISSEKRNVDIMVNRVTD
jgi:hypothetical protein